MSCYDRQGRPMSTDAFMARIGDVNYRVIVHTGLVEDVEVMTFWTGIGRLVDGYPMIFETRVFAGNDLDGRAWRYPSEGAALIGHQMAVVAVRDALTTPVSLERRKA